MELEGGELRKKTENFIKLGEIWNKTLLFVAAPRPPLQEGSRTARGQQDSRRAAKQQEGSKASRQQQRRRAEKHFIKLGAFLLAEARKLTASKEILLWMTPSEAPKALQASECSELLDPMRASCWISAQH